MASRQYGRGERMILKAGTYKFNEVINFPTNVSSSSYFAEYEQNTFTITYDNEIYNVTSLEFRIYETDEMASDEYYPAIALGGENIYDAIDGGWLDGYEKETTILRDIEVDTTLGVMFIANTNYNEVNAIPVAEITYSGGTIAQLNAGDKATIPCKDKKMASDVEIAVSREFIRPYGVRTITENGPADVTEFRGVDVRVPTLDTSDATATANTILSPHTAYVNGEKI